MPAWKASSCAGSISDSALYVRLRATAKKSRASSGDCKCLRPPSLRSDRREDGTLPSLTRAGFPLRLFGGRAWWAPECRVNLERPARRLGGDHQLRRQLLLLVVAVDREDAL